MLALGAMCVAIGLGPPLFWPAIARAAHARQPLGVDLPLPASLVALGAWHITLAVLGTLAAAALWQRVRRIGISRAVTWDCGYAAPSARMQYTAGSFAGIITGWFAWILHPLRQTLPPLGVFPVRASHAERTPETVLEHVMEPAGRAVLAVSTMVRRLQHGRLQAYILYLVVGLAALTFLVFAGGSR
jgi:hydrogenase-4 component B